MNVVLPNKFILLIDKDGDAVDVMSANSSVDHVFTHLRIFDNEFKIFAMETSGYFSKPAIEVLQFLARRKANKAPDEPGLYSKSLRYLYQRVAVANQRGNAGILRAYLARCF